MPSKRKSSRPAAPTAAEVDADADTLDQLAGDPNLIAGIYNYCDRWCERCAFTSRCLSFKMDCATRAHRPGAGEGAAQSFWDDIARSFALARRLIEREARRQGIDLDDVDALVEAEREERQRRRAAARAGSALHQAATGYWKAAKALLEAMRPDLSAAADELRAQARLGAGHPEEVAADISDALEVVQWYLFFIDVKLQRAVASRVDRTRDGDDGFPSDADGSAKIALVAIDRSIGAWARLRGHFPAEADEVLDLLVQLERLRRAVEREFPEARTFRRPGFD
ncbi:MAG: hypothetical protein HZC55_22125 [Verrucomicrobia bacterium]|jgi:hypothetical protein|nr:hypothetical protein [Verrucomicrobiota bacterium]